MAASPLFHTSACCDITWQWTWMLPSLAQHPGLMMFVIYLWYLITAKSDSRLITLGIVFHINTCGITFRAGATSRLGHVSVIYLAQEVDVEAKRLRIPRAGVHVIAHQQHQLQEFAEALALLHLLAGECHAHDLRTDVIHLLLKGQLEYDAVETWP